MPRVNTSCIPDRFRYTRNVSETTDTGFSSLVNVRRTTAAVRFFYVRSPLHAYFYGRALAGSLRAAGCLHFRSANPTSCPPTPFSSGQRAFNLMEAAMRANTPARPEQPQSRNPVQRHPLFARAGAAAAELWLSFPVLSLADFRDLRFRNLLSGLTSGPDDAARRLAFNAAYAARIASAIAEQSHAEVNHG